MSEAPEQQCPPEDGLGRARRNGLRGLSEGSFVPEAEV